jgi:hypothetical protein
MKKRMTYLLLLIVGWAAISQFYFLDRATAAESPIKTPIKYGAVHDTCMRYHKKEVLKACNYLCLYDKPCRDQCIETAEIKVLDKECGKFTKK